MLYFQSSWPKCTLCTVPVSYGHFLACVILHTILGISQLVHPAHHCFFPFKENAACCCILNLCLYLSCTKLAVAFRTVVLAVLTHLAA
jgi:hypothetical protein